jgi:hypothetical protein
MEPILRRITNRRFVIAAVTTLVTLVVLNWVLGAAARRVSANLLHLIPLLAALISLIVGILTLRHVHED